MNKDSKIYVAGHRGMVGSAIVRKLKADAYTNILTRTHAELDLTRQAEVEAFLKAEKPNYLFIAAAKVGGIHANNTYRADFIHENLQTMLNLVHGSHLAGVTWCWRAPSPHPPNSRRTTRTTSAARSGPR